MTKVNSEALYQKYLVETDWLEQNLNMFELRVFDCTVNADLSKNPNPDHVRKRPFTFVSGRAHFDAQHIPRAGFIDILGDLSDKKSPIPMMMPPREQFVSAMQSYGINQDSLVVLYSTTEPNWAARVWWMLRTFGFENAAILNGGWQKWTAEKRPTSNRANTYPSGNFTARPGPDGFVTKETVLKAISDPNMQLINALPSMIHEGTDGPVFGRKGRISGSVNVPYMSMHDPDTGCYINAKELKEKFDAVNTDDAKRIIAYCGGGIASSSTAFALTLLGYNNVAVYDGSMLEWGNDKTLPMERG